MIVCFNKNTFAPSCCSWYVQSLLVFLTRCKNAVKIFPSIDSIPLHLEKYKISVRPGRIVSEVCPMSIAHDCPRLPTPDEKFPDLEDLSVGAFIKGTGALPTFGRASIIKSHFGKF